MHGVMRGIKSEARDALEAKDRGVKYSKVRGRYVDYWYYEDVSSLAF